MAASNTLGTKLKFNPPTGFDTALIRRVSTNIRTNYQCITVMREYSGKSLEELRWEDYTLNEQAPIGVRKSTHPTLHNGGLFASSASTILESSNAASTPAAFSSSSKNASFSSTEGSFGFSTSFSNPTSTVVSPSLNKFQFSNPATTAAFPSFNLTTHSTSLNQAPFGMGKSRDPTLHSGGLFASSASTILASSNAASTSTPAVFSSSKIASFSNTEGNFGFPTSFSNATSVASPSLNKFPFSNPTATTTTFPSFKPTTHSTSLKPTTTSFSFSNPTNTFAFPNLTTTNVTFSNLTDSSFKSSNATTSRFNFSSPSITATTLSSDKLVFSPKEATGCKKDSTICIDAWTQTEVETSVSKLPEGLKEMLLSSNHSDFVLHVKGKEFRVHKVILAAYSPVFSAMMHHDTKEKSTGVANIEDFEPFTVSNLLNFMYTGKLENLNSENALNLYEVADKYQVTELSKHCLNYIMNNLSIENFCDVMTLSLRYCLKDLTDVATEFFLKHSKKIALTPDWATFLKQNPIAGNELFLKALDLKNQ